MYWAQSFFLSSGSYLLSNAYLLDLYLYPACIPWFIFIFFPKAHIPPFPLHTFISLNLPLFFIPTFCLVTQRLQLDMSWALYSVCSPPLHAAVSFSRWQLKSSGGLSFTQTWKPTWWRDYVCGGSVKPADLTADIIQSLSVCTYCIPQGITQRSWLRYFVILG